MQVSGWGLFCTNVMNTILDDLIQDVLDLKEKNPTDYVHSEKAKFLKRVYRQIKEGVPQNPGHAMYDQGTTLGRQYRAWKRIKDGLPDRYRLFFRYSSATKSIVYAWLNDKKTLRNDGSKNDVYMVFRGMLRRGEVAKEYEVLLSKAIELSPTEEQETVL